MINAAKTDIGKCSKQILQKLTEEVNSITKLQQWKSTKEVIEWFKGIQNKENVRFIVFDVVAFYPSISPQLLERALKFARQKVFINDFDINVINHARKTFLYHKGVPWTKKGNVNGFDIAMGAFDGKECCELVGLYILDRLTNGDNPPFAKHNCGIYRDDGLAVIDIGTSKAHTIKTRLEDVFREEGLKIKVKANLTVTDFLDVKLNLATGEYRPYKKPGSETVYIDSQSNHPPNVIKAMPGGIQKRISTLSHSKEIFEAEIRPYQHELDKRGYKCKLQYTPTEPNNSSETKRKRKTLYFNPPWNAAVSTDFARKTFNLIDEHFKEGTLLGRLFNKKTIKIAYSTTRNMEQHIKGHNRNLIEKSVPKDRSPEGCNCQERNLPCFAGGTEDVPRGNCKVECVVYQAEVNSDTPATNEKENIMRYIGLTEGPLKTRYTSHKSDMASKKLKGGTTLSRHIWELKDQNIPYSISWSIKEKCKPYIAGGKDCNLCIAEKAHILEADTRTSLNSRSEMLAMCRHKAKFLLKNVK